MGTYFCIPSESLGLSWTEIEPWAGSSGDVRLSWNTLDPSSWMAHKNIGALSREMRDATSFGGGRGGLEVGAEVVVWSVVEQAEVAK